MANWMLILLIMASITSIVVGLMLSSSGTTSGLTSNNGSDLELFKKTKDRGLVKLLQIIMFLCLIIVFILIILYGCFHIGVVASAE